MIRDYCHRHINLFCQNQNLPTPIYDKSQYGKPFITNIVNFSFNQSHSQTDYALIYSVDIQDIGVDIENLNRKINFDGLAKRYFHEDEYLLWRRNKDILLWFKLWTIKEAVLKAHGLGIRLPLKELNAFFMTDDGGFVYHDRLGKFYFYNKVINNCMITVSYPFEYGEVMIMTV